RGYTCFKSPPNDVGAHVQMLLPRVTPPRHSLRTRTCTEEEGSRCKTSDATDCGRWPTRLAAPTSAPTNGGLPRRCPALDENDARFCRRRTVGCGRRRHGWDDLGHRPKLRAR